MGYLSGHETYDQLAKKMDQAINLLLEEGGDLTRLAEVGEDIWEQHVPQSKKVGDPCPKCRDEPFPCEVMRSFILDPN